MPYKTAHEVVELFINNREPEVSVREVLVDYGDYEHGEYNSFETVETTRYKFFISKKQADWLFKASYYAKDGEVFMGNSNGYQYVFSNNEDIMWRVERNRNGSAILQATTTIKVIEAITYLYPRED